MDDMLDLLDTVQQENTLDAQSSRSQFERARTALTLAKPLQPEVEAAVYRHSRERGVPMPLLRNADNQSMKPEVDVETLESATVSFLAADVNHAAVVKDEVDKVDDIAKVAAIGVKSQVQCREDMLRMVKDAGYSPAQLAELKASGYSPTSQPGVFGIAGGKAHWPVLEAWYMGPEETDMTVRSQLGLQKAMEIRRQSFEKVRGSAWLPGAGRSAATNYIQLLNKENALMREMYAAYGDWRGMGDEELQAFVDRLGAALNLDTGDIAIARLRKSGVGWDTEWEQAANLFGLQNLLDRRDRLAPEELAAVNDNPDDYSLADQMELVDYLEKDSKALRGMTPANRVIEGLAGSVKFGTELAATGPGVGVKALYSGLGNMVKEKGVTVAAKELGKRVGGFLGRNAVNEARRMPAFLGELTMETQDATAPRVIQYIKDGQVIPGLTEAQTTGVATEFFNRVLDRYIENYTEQMGVLAPGAEVLRPLGRFVPQRVKNALAVQYLAQATERLSNTKGAMLSRKITGATAFNGFAGEYMEEKAADAARMLATALAQGFDTRFGDLQQDGMFGSVEDELVTMGTLLATGGLYSSVRLPGMYREARNALRFYDVQSALKARVDASALATRSPEHMEMLLENYLEVGDKAMLFPDKAEVLMQSAPEAMEKLGISRDVVAAAQSEGRGIPVSMARAQAQLKSEELEALVSRLAPPQKIMTVEEAQALDLGEEAVKQIQEAEAEKEAAREAMDETVDQLMDLGRPAGEIRAVSKLLGMANYFGEHSGMKASEWLRNISFRAVNEADFAARLRGDELFQVGDKFATIRQLLPEETATTPLFSEKFNSVQAVLPKLAKIYEAFPNSVPAADGKRVLVKNPEKGSKAARLLHLIASEDQSNGKRSSFHFEKMAWLPRVVETVQNAQAKLRDSASGNYAYVRSYGDGGIHVVVVTQDGVMLEQENYAHGVITQFLEKYAGKRDAFDIVWERPPYQTSDRVLSSTDSNGDVPSSIGGTDKITPSLKNVKRIRKETLKQGERGAISFDESFKAMVTLFTETADASTLVHELAHYAHTMMRHLVDSNLADEQMTADLDALNRWAGNEDAKERVAKAFEAYIMEGKSPAAEIQSAFSLLRRLIQHIYRTAEALGVSLTDEVRSVFDGMLASDRTLDNESILREVTAGINKELLGLTREEVKVYRDLIEKSNRQSLDELTQEKARQLTILRPQWRREAQERMEKMRVYNALRAIKKEGGLDYRAVKDILGEELADEFRAKGLTNAKKKSGKHPASFAAENNYGTVEQMLDELFDAKTPARFVSDHVTEQETAFHEAFELSEGAVAVAASIEALENLSAHLAVKGGIQGATIRRHELKQRAQQEIDLMKVGQVVSDKALINSCKVGARKLTKAANAKDFTAAFEEAQKLRYNLEVLRLKADAKKRVTQVEKTLYRARHAKKGALYGDYQEVLRELSRRFGFSKGARSEYDPGALLDDINDGIQEEGGVPLNVPRWIVGEGLPYRQLQMEQFRELGDFIDFLYGEGRDIVSARNATFRRNVKERVDACVAELTPLEHNKTHYQDALGAVKYGISRTLLAGSKLRNIFARAARHNPDSALQKIYDDMAMAESEHYQLYQEVSQRVVVAQTEIAKTLKDINLDGLPEFPEDARSAYRKWTTEYLINCCMNMGTVKNRQRLMDGFGWTEADLEDIASRLSESDWKNIDRIWDAVGKGSLTSRLRREFKDEYHYDMKMEEAVPFTVHTADGKSFESEGGYYPLAYTGIRRRAYSDPIQSVPAPDFLNSGFTKERKASYDDVLRLDYRVLPRHMFEVAHYVSHRHVMRGVLRAVQDPDFKRHFSETQGFARYDTMLQLVKNVARPEAGVNDLERSWENWGRSILSATALWMSPSVVVMQLSSATIGISELGSYYFNAAAEIAASPIRSIEMIKMESAMMRDRMNMKDMDMRTSINALTDGTARKTQRKVAAVGFWGMQFLDLRVAAPLWLGAFNKALDEGYPEHIAVARADEMVAKTQGAARSIDMSPVQLFAIGRILTPFFSAASAATTTVARDVNKLFSGKMTLPEAAFTITTDMLFPFLLLAPAARWALAGGFWGDDDDKATKAYIKELISGPLGGLPVVRDFADYAGTRVANAVTGDSRYQWRTILEAAPIRAANDIVLGTVNALDAAFEGDAERALYHGASAVGSILKIPAIQVFERAKRIYNDNFGD